MPSNQLILSHPLLLPSVFPSIRVFSNGLALCIRWPKYWSISISLSQEYSGFISYRIDWFVLLTVQGILMSLLQHNLKAILQLNSDNNRDFNTPFSTTFLSRSPRWKISKEILDLNYTLDQMALIDIYKTFHSTKAENTFFVSSHETCSRMDHMLGRKTSLNKFKNTEITSSIFSKHNSVKLITRRKCKVHKYVEIKQHVSQQMSQRRNQKK